MADTLYKRLKAYENTKSRDDYRAFMLTLLSEECAEINLYIPMTFAEDGRNLYTLAQYGDNYLYIACIPGEKLPDNEVFTTVKLCDFVNMLIDDTGIYGVYFNPYNGKGIIIPSDLLRNLTGR